MNEDYLWDRAGEPDPEVVRLEQALSQLRWQPKSGSKMPGQARLFRWSMAAAAAVLLVSGAVMMLERWKPAGALTSWQLSVAGGKATAVRTGQVIDTGGRGLSTMQSNAIGRLEIEPNSRLRVMAVRNQEHRMALDHGTIHALIWAPPTRFVVDTPSAKTVDLGCQYTLRVTADGTGLLTVQTGWVGFEWNSIESFIPAGAACTTRPKRGPDTPYFADAPEDLRKALARFDSTGNRDALETVLATARPRDGLTLWHLLRRTQGTERSDVYTKFAKLVKLPPRVTETAILSGDSAAFDAAWDALQLGDTKWWREWKRRW